MTNDARTADDIERDIEEERAQMSGTLNDLQKKFSVEGIVRDVGDMFRDQGGDLGRMVIQAVGRNPAALALTGVGLVWMFLGSGSERDDRDDPSRDGKQHRRPSSKSERSPRDTLSWADRRSQRWAETPYVSFDNADSSWIHDSQGHADRPTKRRAPGPMGRFAEDNPQYETKADLNSDDASSGGERLNDAGASLRDTAMGLADRLARGTEGLPEVAKARVVAARQAAYDARKAAESSMKNSGRMATNFFEDQPLVVGALAVALGAAIAGALPHSRIEDESMGASSDRLFADAQAIFREETEKAKAVLASAKDEAAGALSDTGAELAGLLPEGQTLAQVVTDRVSDAATRVIDAAKEEVQRQGDSSRDV